MKTLSRFLTGLLKILGALLLLLVAVSAVLLALGVRVELDPLREPVELAAEQAIGREVSFEGRLSLVPTLWPTLEVQEVAIANTPGWSEKDFARAGLLRLQLGLVPLLRGEIQVGEITAEQVRLNLESDRDGKPNWQFGDPAAKPSADPEASAEPSRSIRFTALNSLSLQDIEVNYLDQQLDHALRLRLKEMKGNMADGEPVELAIRGQLQDHDVIVNIDGGSLADLYTQTTNWPLKLDGELAATPFEGEGVLVRGGEPEIQAEVQVGAFDLGALLARLQVVTGLDANVERLSSKVVLRGDSLKEWITTSDLSFLLEGGEWVLTDANTGGQLPIHILKGDARMQPGQPLKVDLEATLDEQPVAIQIRGAEAAEIIKPGAELPLSLAVTGGGADLLLESRVVRPITTTGIGFTLTLRGESLDGLDSLMKTDLPPWGPYSLTGGFAINPDGYVIDGLRLTMGETSLDGKLSLDTKRRPPYLDIDLSSDRLQIDDFRLGDWSPAKGTAQPDLPETEPQAAAEAGSTGLQDKPVRSLLDPETLSALDARLAVEVKQVLSGQDQLGRGSLLLTLEGTKLEIDPLEADLPGGSAQARFLYHPSGGSLDLDLAAKIEEFDYGVLARRIDPKSEVGGRISLDVALTAQGDSPDALLTNGRGHLDFGLWPEQLEADLFDLWAVSLVGAMLTEVDKEDASRVNCLVARFQLKDGVMNEKVIFADTTNMSVEGRATIDFKQRNIEVKAKPKAKNPQMFALATPVAMRGSFEDFRLRINPVAIGGTAVSFVTSPVHAPIRKLFKGEVPANGVEACSQAWTAETEDEEQESTPGSESAHSEG